MQKSKDEIIVELKDSFDTLLNVSSQVKDEAYNLSNNNKWTVAENVQHIINATKMTSLAFTLPKFVHVFLYGKPNRTSHGYGKVVENYQKKLDEGAKASGLYVPKKADYEKAVHFEKLNAAKEKLAAAIAKKWKDEELDRYQISHPILGLLTVRELAYFTLYHNAHHTETIRKNYLNA